MFNIFFILGELLIIASTAIFFLSEKLYQFLPENYVPWLLNNKLFLLLAGVVLSMIGIVKFVLDKKRVYEQQLKNQQKQLTDKHKATERSRISQHNHTISHQNESRTGIFTVDKTEIYASRQADAEQMKIASNTSWEPLSASNSNMQTHSLVSESNSRLVTQPHKNMWLMGGAFALFGIGAIIGFFATIIFGNKFEAGSLFFLFFGLAFSAVGWTIVYFPRKRIFDRSIGWFWVGKSSLNQSGELNQLKQSCLLTDIVALQLLSKMVDGDESADYRCYQLNVVCTDGERFNVMSHGNKDAMFDDAEQLSEFLAVPILKV